MEDAAEQHVAAHAVGQLVDLRERDRVKQVVAHPLAVLEGNFQQELRNSQQRTVSLANLRSAYVSMDNQRYREPLRGVDALHPRPRPVVGRDHRRSRDGQVRRVRAAPEQRQASGSRSLEEIHLVGPDDHVPGADQVDSQLQAAGGADGGAAARISGRKHVRHRQRDDRSHAHQVVVPQGLQCCCGSRLDRRANGGRPVPLRRGEMDGDRASFGLVRNRDFVYVESTGILHVTTVLKRAQVTQLVLIQLLFTWCGRGFVSCLILLTGT